MNFLPVITRELQVQARQPATNRMRWIAAAAVIGLAVFLMAISGNASPQERAKLIFIVIGIVGLGGAMLAGVFQTADCLSEERREGTLGLLFLTDLKGYDVVLGKLASTSLQSFYNFLAIIPILALPLLMGGMTVGEFWRVALVLVVTLYLSLAVGMFISAVVREARGAMGAAFLLMLLLAGVLPVFWWLSVVGGWSAGMKFLLFPAPPFAFQQAFHNYYSVGNGQLDYWGCITTMLGIGSACLVVACYRLPRLWREPEQRVRPAKERLDVPGWKFWARRSQVAQQELRGLQPFFWLAKRDAQPQRIAGLAFAVLLPLWLIFFYQMWPGNNRTPGVAFPLVLLLTFGMHVLLKCLMAVEATRRFSEDRQSGALELLLVTPLPISEIIASQARGVWHSFRWGFLTLTLMNLALISFFTRSDMFGQDMDTLAVFVLLMLGGIVMLYLDAYAIVRFGMWMALIKLRHARAFMATMLRVLLPPWLAIILFFFMAMVGAIVGGGPGSMGALLFAWFILGGVVDFFAALPATTNLESNFREVASLGRLEARPDMGSAGFLTSSKE